ncbi:MAG: lipoate--protein ligase family protein [Nitrospinae bacterium]|nr:lipoate--protein ligase family protein [Nitrospinota bacterium]
MERWRLIVESPAPGAWNMAADAALWESAQSPGAAPALRLYQWDRPTVSLGYAQDAARGLNVDYLAREEIPLVRRPTGGRAVLHDREVTYSVAIPASSPRFGSLTQVYAFTRMALAAALASLGARVDDTAEHGAGRSAVCFASRARHEIAVNGRKVVGSAQRRTRGALLQHGSIILDTDRSRLLDCFIWDSGAKRAQAAHVLGAVNEALPRPVSPDQMAAALISAFERLHGIVFEVSALSARERERAEALAPGFQITGALV